MECALGNNASFHESQLGVIWRGSRTDRTTRVGIRERPLSLVYAKLNDTRAHYVYAGTNTAHTRTAYLGARAAVSTPAISRLETEEEDLCTSEENEECLLVWFF
jgi:hypothetical protein